jgi:hypothetical protein
MDDRHQLTPRNFHRNPRAGKMVALELARVQMADMNGP